MKVIENKYGRFGLEISRNGNTKRHTASNLLFQINKDIDIEEYKLFIKPECFDEFEAYMNKYKSIFSYYHANIFKDDLMTEIKEEIYNGNWDEYKIIHDGFEVTFKINNMITVELSLDFVMLDFVIWLEDFTNRSNIELFMCLKNDLKERERKS